MRASSLNVDRMKNSFGWLCLAATLLLMSPGVHAVRADDDKTPILPSPPAVQSEKPDREPEQRGVDPTRSKGVINLNTRGYNYGPDRPTVHQEAARAAVATKAAQTDRSPTPTE